MKKYKLFLLIRSSKSTVAKKELKLETVVKPDLLKKLKLVTVTGRSSQVKIILRIVISPRLIADWLIAQTLFESKTNFIDKKDCIKLQQ